ncbi:REP-associated tyrosine transposase [Basfia succiniciproducens]|uniref:REP-associated tyrosine transposase n=1 Tax=Basfia succiniciproducens TaxID=653940 RepID=UPI0008CD2F33|nr:transposase [Basfia succiniciproducens]SEQ70785.1 REP element-mobilizing transposase RayT [Basfia succiniciproducens]
MRKIEHYRKRLRLPFYDYSQYGCYFVTICTKDRQMVFGEVIDGEMKLNHFGKMMREALFSVLDNYRNSEISEYVIMPNHLHFIWFNQDDVNLSIVIKKIKGMMTHLYREYHKTQGLSYLPLWQRGFYEHIIRNDKDYERIVEYIENNPIQWHLDRFYTL